MRARDRERHIRSESEKRTERGDTKAEDNGYTKREIQRSRNIKRKEGLDRAVRDD